MLKSLTLTHWKSFGAVRNELRLSPLTLLVGPNGSGKSNALDALRFLQGAALDFPLGDVLRGRWEGQREIWPAIRGQAQEAARLPLTKFGMECEWGISPQNPSWLGYAIEVDTSEDVWLEAERVERHMDYAFDTRAPALKGATARKHGTIRAAMRSRGKGNSATEAYMASRSLLGQVGEGTRVHPSMLRDVRYVRDSLRALTFLSIDPARMRDYRPEHASSLGSSCENISPWLAKRTPREREDITDWLGELSAPGLTEIGVSITDLREVMFYLREGIHRISARSVSDGTLRFLGLVTALLTSTPGSIIVLEEPDVGLHPARIHLLARLLEQATSKGGLQVIATTHSPTLLAHLSPESLANVVALGRDSEGATVCQRIGDLPDFATLRDSARLDHLVSTGWLERAI